MRTVRGWKLLRRRKDGTVGPLFIYASLRVPLGKWMRAESHPTPGYAYRPGWHCTRRRHAPHLRTTGPDRVWCRVSLRGVTKYDRPESQGGAWLLAKHMRIEYILEA